MRNLTKTKVCATGLGQWELLSPIKSTQGGEEISAEILHGNKEIGLETLYRGEKMDMAPLTIKQAL